MLHAPMYKFRTDFFLHKYLRIFTDLKYEKHKASRSFNYSFNINKHYFPKLANLLGVNTSINSDIFYNHFFFEKWGHKYNYKNDTINLSNLEIIKYFLLKHTKIKRNTLIRYKKYYLKKIFFKNIKIKK